MRLWSLHPKYLDARGLAAVWREGLLAKKVLEGKTKGYRNHPQLKRFRQHPHPLKAINNYLHNVADEAENRGYRFSRDKLAKRIPSGIIRAIHVTQGQLIYEFRHLKAKLKARHPATHVKLLKVKSPDSHPILRVKKGKVERWEKI